MTPTQLLNAGAELLEEGFPETVIFRGETIPANVTDILTGRGDREAGGQYPILSGTVLIRATLLDDKPNTAEEITVRGQKLFIGDVREDSVGWEIELKPKNRRP